MERLDRFQNKVSKELGRVRFTRKHIFRTTQIKQAKIHNWEETTIHNQVYLTFKELIRKAGITDGNAIYQYSLGLTTDKYRSMALTNPTTLQGWYDAAHRLFNIDSHLGNINHNTRSEWDMDVDVISVNALSREERERHVRNNLCFICHKDRHVSKECPDRKPYKGGFKSGKYKGKYKKGKRFTKGRHI
jgi:hypothetical protein